MSIEQICEKIIELFTSKSVTAIATFMTISGTSIIALFSMFRSFFGGKKRKEVHSELIQNDSNDTSQNSNSLKTENNNEIRKEEECPNQKKTISSIELPHYKAVYNKELETESIEAVAEKIAMRILNGECFRLELDEQILPIINKIIYNRKNYHLERQDDMVKVPKGSFIMGGPNKTRVYPIKVDYIPYDYWIDITPVTIAQYRKYLEEAGEVNNYGHKLEPNGKNHYPSPDTNYGITGPKLYKDYFGDPVFDDYPVTFVDWWDAYSYAKWAGKDLPFEKEWEKAARGVDGRIFPYGNEYDSNLCNTEESKVGKLTPVHTYVNGASPYGCLDMSGNAWEWCVDDYSEDQTKKLKVVKGGSFRRGRNKSMTFSCNPREPVERWISRGFRCVRRINENE